VTSPSPNRIGHLFLVIAAFFVLTSSADAQDFTVLDFEDNIVINRDSSFTVRETITVEFHRPSHGIYRDIPTAYTDSLGGAVRTPTRVFSVNDGRGKEIKHKDSLRGNMLHIRIGDPEKYVSGAHVYEILYKVENALLFFDDHDELYWNVTGNYWQAEIKKSGCTVSLAPDIATKDFWASCYTGRMGQDESVCKYKSYGRSIEFTASRRLIPSEGLTIAYGWNKGLVLPPSRTKKLLWSINLAQNWIFAIPFFSLFLMLRIWYWRGRDPKVRQSVMVTYGPPKCNDRPLSPAEVGALLDERLDSRDITATIVGLAVGGYIRIEEVKKEGIIFDSKDHYLEKLREPDDALTLFEKELMTCLFGSLKGRMASDLKNTFYKNIDSLKRTLYADLVRDKFFLVSPEKVRVFYIAAGAVVAAGLLFLFNSLLESAGPFRIFSASILSALPVIGMARYMPAKTKTGAMAYMDILGFEEFLNRAEKDRLTRMDDQDLFSKFLPYALALNVADSWAKAFEGIYQNPPQWYSSPGGFGTFRTADFNRSLGSAMSSISSAMFSAPRSSGIGGSGGGGSSGGGFGGGGGGSW